MTNDRSVAYLTNEHPFYMRMCLNSVSMLRQHNTSIPVRVFLIKDKSNQTIERENVSRHVHVGEEVSDKFKESCEKVGVEVWERPPLMYPGEEDFFHINRKYLAEVPEPSVLMIDSDSFVFQNIERIHENYQFVDFAACKAVWAFGRGWRYDFLAVPVGPFSSGVMLWNNGSVRDWCDLLPTYLSDFRKNDTPLAHWLHELNPNCLLREEFSVTKHISQSSLTHSFMEESDCHLLRTEQCLDKIGDSVLFHCYTPFFSKAFAKLNAKSRARIKPLKLHAHRPPQTKQSSSITQHP